MADIAQASRNYLASLIETKRHACERRRGPADLGPMVQVEWADGNFSLAIVDDRDNIPDDVQLLCEDRRNHGLPDVPIRAALLGDTVERWYEPGEETPDPGNGRGTVLRARAEGDMRVTDALMVLVVEPGGEAFALRQPYGYRDDGQPRFGPVDQRHEVGGEMIVLLRKAMDEARRA